MKRFDTIEAAITDLKQGKLIIVCDDEKRENEGDLVALAEFVTPEIINFMVTHGRGLVCVPLSLEYANKLDLSPMMLKNTDNFKTAFTVSVDHITNSTGISASDRATTIQRLVADDAKPDEFRRPGHIFPLVAKKLGVLERSGHTEAVVDLAKISNSKESGVLCEIMNSDGTMARYDDLVKFKEQHNLKMIAISDLIEYRKRHEVLVKLEIEAGLPTKFGEFRIYGYSSIVDDKEHVVIVKEKKKQPKNNSQDNTLPLVRLHSECLTGDVFHSLRCDCGEQLELAMKQVEEYGYGAILYLRQEGRGIGLFNKLKAYKLQEEKNLDTVEANEALGFAADLREYSIAAHILKHLGFDKIKLLTNNPAKKEGLEEYGIKVFETVPAKSEPRPENADYLKVKVEKMRHML